MRDKNGHKKVMEYRGISYQLKVKGYRDGKPAAALALCGIAEYCAIDSARVVTGHFHPVGVTQLSIGS